LLIIIIIDVFLISLVEECDKEENVLVTWAADTSVGKGDYKTFRPMSRIRSVTARPAPQ
jgi:hypothetical protein